MDQVQEQDASFEGRITVRRYTEELQGSNELERAVQAPLVTPWGTYDDTGHRQELKRLFQNGCDDTEETFWDAERERKRLASAFSEFQKTLPEPKEKRFKTPWSKEITSKEKVDLQLKKMEVTNMNDVEGAIKESEDKWKEKDRLLGGKLQQGFHRVCKSLNSYSGIFALFPSDNEYVTVLCGSLKLIVASSVRHMETAEFFVESLGDALSYIDVVMIYGGLMDIEPLRRLISKLYGKVFEFLRFAMLWWASNGLSKTIRALGKGFYEDLQKKTRDIELICKEIDSQAHARGLAENRYIRIVGDETNSMVRDLARRDSHLHKLSDSNMRLSRDNEALHRKNEILHERLLQKQRDYDEAVRKKTMELDYQALGTQMIRSLEDIFRMRMVDQSDVSEITQRVRELTPGSEDQLSTHYIDNLGTTEEQADRDNPHVLLREDALNVAQALDSYIFGMRVAEDPGHKYANFSGAVLSRLHKWSRESSSQCLWVIGEPDHALPSNMCTAASAMIATAQKLDIKLISHFCELPMSQARREEGGMISLVYSLIVQLLEMMPPMINADEVPLNLGRLSRLDGTMDTWYEALDLLEELLQHNPWPLLLCVIDGLTRLDFGTGSPRCEEFIDLLLKHFEATDKIFKILLTSSGNTGKDTGLGRQIPIEKRIYANDRDEQPLDLTKSLSESREGTQEPPDDLK